MSTHLAIIGPGRVGRALGRRWVEAGIELLGFLGRDARAADEAVRFCGAGRVLDNLAAVCEADTVVLSVGDDQLAAAASAAAAAGPRPGSLWLHCSGRFGLEVLGELEASGAELGSLHPLCPFPDAETGHGLLPGKTAVVEGQADLLVDLARQAGLKPLKITAGDRAVYHAGCVLAANGLTALNDLVKQLFQLHGGIDEAPRLAVDLMAAALQACMDQGPVRALSGPVLRGDSHTVTSHLESLRAVAPHALATYLALMRHAVEMSRTRGLSDPDARALLDLLDAEAADG